MMNFIDKTAMALGLLASSSFAVSGAVTTEEWNSLSSQLSSPSALQVTDLNAWLEQCISPFDVIQDENGTLVEISALGAGIVSNYRLFEQPSGLCMQIASCAFNECKGLFFETYAMGILPFWASENYTLYPAYPFLAPQTVIDAAAGPDSQLPEAVVHPVHAGDVVASIRFAKDKGLGVSVKTSGHNWMGSSTRKGTLLLNLSKLRKYALPETLEAAVFECASSSSSSMTALEAACKLSLARVKPAIIRFGGGQIVDEGLTTLEAWNAITGKNPYHAMIGAAGTVSAVGGWMQSGGLGGPLAHRMYGVGVDQVLHVEMVLPDGRFVRFGPSDWALPQGDQLYPQTTEVTGYCNDASNLGDEASWNWVPCDSPTPNFADLWFAVRGGGGGNYGVLTSVYYQLHPKTQFQAIITAGDGWGITKLLANPDLSDEVKVTTLSLFQQFLFTFLFNPSKISVPVSVSNGCSAPDLFVLFCYNGSGQAFVDAWVQYDPSSAMPLEAQDYSSYAVFMKDFVPNELGYPSDFSGGRSPDFPLGQTIFVASNPIVFPIDVLQNKMDQFLELWIPCYVQTILDPSEPCMSNDGNPYIYGGSTQFASDGMDAYPSHRRNGGIHIQILNQTVQGELKQLFGLAEAQEDGEIFPGIFCHNHMWASASPRKSNWLEECSGEDDCMSYPEAAFGTQNLRRLQKIHAEIDPNRMFDASDGPGYPDIEASGGGEERPATTEAIPGDFPEEESEDIPGDFPEEESEDPALVGKSSQEDGAKLASAGMPLSFALAWFGSLVLLPILVV